ncbi:MAG TPA: alpha/beta hydrolase [Vicinamibacterales bacterium]
MFDKGTGPALIVIPGVQGRWEWMRPALEALSRRCRTISYSLAGDFGARHPRDARVGFGTYLDQLDDVIERTGVQQAAVCGVSYGGLIALRYAATRSSRVSSLIIASSPAPGWKPNPRQTRYVGSPWLMAPAFVATGPLRLWPEIKAAFDTRAQALQFALRHGARVAAAPIIPSLMAERITLQQQEDFAPDCSRVTAPTLVVTGEPRLDQVVPVEITRAYASLIRGARYEMMERTGHIGLVTRPRRFSELVCGFVHAHHH